MTTQPNSNQQAPEVNTELSRKKKLLGAVAVLMVPFSLCMYILFSPAPQAPEPGSVDGLNVEFPDGVPEQIERDKRRASAAAVTTKIHGARTLAEVDILTNPLVEDTTVIRDIPAPQDHIRRSRNTYMDIHRQLDNFGPAGDPQVEELQRKVHELTEKLERQQGSESVPDPMELIRSSYDLARSFSAGEQGPQPREVGKVRTGEGRIESLSVEPITDRTVSSLMPAMDDSTLGAMLSVDRNFSFNTAVGKPELGRANSIRATIEKEQTVMDGMPVQIKLSDAISVGQTRIPQNTVVTGICALQNNRLTITIKAIEYRGLILPVNLCVYDTDGMEGIYVANTTEQGAIQDAAANMSNNFGSGISISRNAGQQVAMDLSRGLISGGTQYLASKSREVKVTLKANHKLLLMQNENR